MKANLVVSRSATGRLWFLHPENDRSQVLETCRASEYPSIERAEEHLRALNRKVYRRVPGLKAITKALNNMW